MCKIVTLFLNKDKLCLHKILIMNSQAIHEMVLPLFWACFVLAGTRIGHNPSFLNGKPFGMNPKFGVQVPQGFKHFQPKK